MKPSSILGSKNDPIHTETELSGGKVVDAAAVTPNNATDLAKGVTAGLYLGGAGDVNVTLKNGTQVTFKSLASGIVHPIAVKRVWATGTTATNIVAVY